MILNAQFREGAGRCWQTNILINFHLLHRNLNFSSSRHCLLCIGHQIIDDLIHLIFIYFYRAVFFRHEVLTVDIRSTKSKFDGLSHEIIKIYDFGDWCATFREGN